MTHFSSGGDKFLGGENLLELLAFEAYAQNFETLKEKGIVIAKPNYDRIDTQRFGSFMQNSRGARLNLQTIASSLRHFLENLNANIVEELEEHEEVDVKVCCVDSQSIKVGLFKGDQLIYESEVEKL